MNPIDPGVKCRIEWSADAYVYALQLARRLHPKDENAALRAAVAILLASSIQEVAYEVCRGTP